MFVPKKATIIAKFAFLSYNYCKIIAKIAFLNYFSYKRITL